MTRILSIALLTIGFLFTANNVAVSQDFQMQQQAPDIGEVTDAELRSFVAFSMEAQTIQQDAQVRMIEKVEENDISVDRYNEIVTGQHQGAGDEVFEDSAEQERFEKVYDIIEGMQDDLQEQIYVIVENHDLEIDRVEEIQMALQMDQDLQERYMEILQEIQGQG